MEFIVYFIFGFMTTWIIAREVSFSSEKKKCPMKQSIHELAMCRGYDKELMKRVKHYSLLKIQDGHFEYQEVLESLKKEGKKNDKAKS